MVTSIRCIGTRFSFAYTSISVTPQDEMAPRKASLLVKASGCGCVDESSTRRWPRAWLTARPMVPLLDDRIVSILTLLMKAPPRGSVHPWFDPPAAGAELDADPQAGMSHLRHGVFPGELARAAHDQQIAPAEIKRAGRAAAGSP